MMLLITLWFAYIGAGKLIPSAKRTDIIFHAKRGMQEFSYDTLRTIKSQELTISPSLTAVIPQDYVNYVRLSWIDQLGVKRIIYPNTNLTINPAQAPEQDSTGQNSSRQLGGERRHRSTTNSRKMENC